MKEFLDMHSAPGGGKSNAVRAGVSSRTGRAVEHRIRRTDHEQPDLHVNRTHQWVGVHKYVPGMYGSFIPTDPHVETCTDHTDRTRSEYNVPTNPAHT